MNIARKKIKDLENLKDHVWIIQKVARENNITYRQAFDLISIFFSSKNKGVGWHIRNFKTVRFHAIATISPTQKSLISLREDSAVLKEESICRHRRRHTVLQKRRRRKVVKENHKKILEQLKQEWKNL